MNKTKEENQETNETTPSNTHTAKGKSHKKYKKYIYLILFVSMVSLFAFGWKIYDDKKTLERQEQLDLAVLCEYNYNIEDFQNFLSKYPSSSNCRKVKQRLAKLHKLKAAWEEIASSQNANAFINFKNKYNDEHYARLCNLKLDTIDWQNALSANHPDAYQEYINRHPNGGFLYDAIEAKQQVAYMSITPMEASQIRSVCQQFFNAVEFNDTAVIRQLLASEVENFLSYQQPNNDDIYRHINHKKQQHKFLTYLLHEEVTAQKDVNENNDKIFTASFLVDQITTNERGEEKVDTLKTIMKMNKDYQIFSFSVEQI